MGVSGFGEGVVMLSQSLWASLHDGPRLSVPGFPKAPICGRSHDECYKEQVFA